MKARCNGDFVVPFLNRQPLLVRLLYRQRGSKRAASEASNQKKIIKEAGIERILTSTKFVNNRSEQYGQDQILFFHCIHRLTFIAWLKPKYLLGSQFGCCWDAVRAIMLFGQTLGFVSARTIGSGSTRPLLIDAEIRILGKRNVFRFFPLE